MACLANVSAKITLNQTQVQVNCPDENSFRLVQQFLTLNQTIVNFHTFPLPNEKTLKIVLKGVPLDVYDEELNSELTSIGFEPKIVHLFFKNGKRIPLHMV